MNLIIFDLETTGLLPSQHEIIQIAAVKVKDGRWDEGEYFDSYVRPENRIPSFITKLTGISQAQVADAPSPVEVLTRFSQFVGQDATLIAHNGLRFDMRFIAENCKRHGIPVRETSALDSRAFSRKIWGGRGGHGLDAVLGRVGVSSKGVRRHDARGDVQLLAQAVQYMWERLTPSFSNCPVELSVGVIPALEGA
ncbi:3'-5' exonuclease [Prosthecobacter sp.]|uniref:3'-5' exonuclease n=1 Tax=Prosthecobacter sp. TaxID=1965333 RepID=UPI001DFC9D4A|nr:3'-5' exonuclease [Prosthecobacter sp.]MCB1277175.1 3'-5' exonuclease [Prosthecobacter sp.]